MKKIMGPILVAVVLLLGSAFPSYAGGGGWGGHGGGGGSWHGGGGGGWGWHGGGWNGGWGWHGGWHSGGVVIGVGPGFWGPWWYGPGYPYYPYPYPYPYDPYPYYGGTAPVVQQDQVYIQQPEPQAQQPSYWYYCQNPQGYYPQVQQCPGGWMTVVPPTTAPPR
jgi:hypothetical protein